MKDVTGAKEIEEIKREYYKKHINGRIDTSFLLDTEEERMEFLELCKYVGSLLSLGEIFKAVDGLAIVMCHIKHFLFALYVLSFPLRDTVPCLLFYILAHMVSLA